MVEACILHDLKSCNHVIMQQEHVLKSCMPVVLRDKKILKNLYNCPFAGCKRQLGLYNKNMDWEF